MLALAFFGMSHKDTTGTRIGRITIIVLLILKYLYFFTRIKTIKAGEKQALRAASEPAEGVTTNEVGVKGDRERPRLRGKNCETVF